MSDTPLKVAVNGAAGRNWASALFQLTLADPELELAGAVEYEASPQMGKDAGEICGAGHCGVAVTAELTDRVDVVIDFSLPEALDSVLTFRVNNGRIPLVIATTGYSDEQRDSRIATAAQSTPVVMAPSMSMAVNLVP